MITIPKETLDKIHSLAKQLGDAISEANLRLLAKNGSCDWSATLMVVPYDVEMSDTPGIKDEKTGEEYDSLEEPDEWLLGEELDCTVYSTETNELYNPGESGRDYF